MINLALNLEIEDKKLIIENGQLTIKWKFSILNSQLSIVFCGSSSVVECLLAKEKVAGSSPVFRSFFAKQKMSETRSSPKDLSGPLKKTQRDSLKSKGLERSAQKNSARLARSQSERGGPLIHKLNLCTLFISFKA